MVLQDTQDRGPDQSNEKNIGIAFWASRVAAECKRARRGFDPDAVHDLRVALRRCRSLADGYMALDQDPSWREMRQAGKIIFRRLGELRDTQVMIHWVQSLSDNQDEAGSRLRESLAVRESQLMREARDALQHCSGRQWVSWGRLLSERSDYVPLGNLALAHLALERLHDAHRLHRQACRNRSKISYHRLRIGLKRFRYTIENFLPEIHEAWGQDLRELQDALGEMHDLDMLWQTALKTGIFADAQVRAHWSTLIEQERQIRLDRYRSRMLGKASLWSVWRAGLPAASRVQDAAAARLLAWASFRDPDPEHSGRVARLALQLYDKLTEEGMVAQNVFVHAPAILGTAAQLRGIGLVATQKNSQRAAYDMIRRLDPPLGWTADDLRAVALVVRYQAGPFPNVLHRRFRRLSEKSRRRILLYAAIIRLAAALIGRHGDQIEVVQVRSSEEGFTVFVSGAIADGRLDQKCAEARVPLETILRASPILIRTWTP
jgi:CHAD domain-containing protein